MQSNPLGETLMFPILNDSSTEEEMRKVLSADPLVTASLMMGLVMGLPAMSLVIFSGGLCVCTKQTCWKSPPMKNSCRLTVPKSGATRLTVEVRSVLNLM